MIRRVLSLIVFASVGCSDDPAAAPDARDGTGGDADTADDGTSDGADDGDAEDGTGALDGETDVEVDPDWPWPREAITVAPDASWKARISFPDEPFLARPRSFDVPEPRWVKLTVLTGDESLVTRPMRRVVAPLRAMGAHIDGRADGALAPDYAGIRPKLGPAGTPPADFRIEGPRDHGVPGLINLFGIESPGLTSSLAIGDYVAGLLDGDADAVTRLGGAAA